MKLGKGVHNGILDTDYRELPHVSKSDLDKWVKGDDDKKGRHLLVGTALHTAVLEGGDKYRELYHVADVNFKLNTNVGKQTHIDLVVDNPGKLILRPQEHELVIDMARALKAHPEAAAILEADRPVEQTIIGTLPDFTVTSKCRIDKVCAGFLMDVKTSGYMCESDFINAMIDYGYHAQAAYYTDLYEAVTGDRKRFRFLCVSKGGDNSVWIIDISNQLLAAGRAYYRSILTLYERYETTGDKS